MRPRTGLLAGDLRLVLRDPILVLAAAIPLVLALLLRLGVPVAAELLGDRVDIRPYLGLLLVLAVIMAPGMLGWLAGFLLLDERDEGVMRYVAVTPTGRSGFLAYRLAVPVAASFVLAFPVAALAGIVEVDYLRLVPVAAIAALEAPLMAMYLAAFAGNKVEGLALAKAAGVFAVAPAAILTESNWQYLAGIAPPFWPAKLFLLGDCPALHYWLVAAGGLAVHGAYFACLLSRFRAKLD